MQIPDDALDDFIAIYKEVIGDELTREQALEIATRLLTLYSGMQSAELKPPVQGIGPSRRDAP